MLEEVEFPLGTNGQDAQFIRGGVPPHRYVRFRGVGALHRAGPVHRSGGGVGCRQPHLHHAAGGAGSREDGSGIDAPMCPCLV